MKIVATKRHSVGPSHVDWRDEIKRAIRDPAELAAILELNLASLPTIATPKFPLFAPRPFVQRMRPGDPADPLLLQVWPSSKEAESNPGFGPDPVGDQRAQKSTGVIHKYPGRVLLVMTGACAIHCRYCFRREFPYSNSTAWKRTWPTTLEFLRNDPTIEEVILSGGDPLTLDDTAWEEIMSSLEKVSHVKRLRIHTRLPIMVPQRIHASWIRRLDDSRLTPVLVIHANHAAELDSEVQERIEACAEKITVLNQAVLLRGINDSVSSQAALSQRLVECRALPYYLNLLDRVQGAAHFEVPVEEAKEIHRELRSRVPGYFVPRLVRDTGEGNSKQVVA